jgi:plastocyanin
MTTSKSPTTFKVNINHTVAVADSSAANSSAFASETREVRIVCTVDAYVEFGSSPTATSGSLIVPAYTPEYFRVAPGTKVAFLRVGSVTGTARITELTQ